MSVHSSLLLIADIAGYTRFMRLHAVSLAHAHDVVSQLIESVIDAAGPELELAKLEGDAAFFHRPLDGATAVGEAWIAARVAAIHSAFHRRAADLARNTLCPCDGCQQAGSLRIKLVGHLGEVAVRKIRRMTELAGVDVIIVHRLLKVRVPMPEYLLMTAPLYRRIGADAVGPAEPVDVELEGIGTAEGWVVDLGELASRTPDPAPALSWLRRLVRHARLTWRSMPYFLGRRKACDGFRNVEARARAVGGSPADD